MKSACRGSKVVYHKKSLKLEHFSVSCARTPRAYRLKSMEYATIISTGDLVKARTPTLKSRHEFAECGRTNTVINVCRLLRCMKLYAEDSKFLPRIFHTFSQLTVVPTHFRRDCNFQGSFDELSELLRLLKKLQLNFSDYSSAEFLYI